MVNLTNADEKIVEAMARAECEAFGINPDVIQTFPGDDGYTRMPAWQTVAPLCRRHLVRHRAMLAAMVDHLEDRVE